MKFAAAAILATGIAQARISRSPEEIDPNGDISDAYLSFEEMCAKYGFQYEEHEVVTDDGYHLTMLRIPGRIGDFTTGKPPIILQHGITDSADTWIMNYDTVAPAFQSARDGYDVWMGNNRGNKYSTGHDSLSWDEDAYWQFDFQEMGTGDQKANISYIIELTGYDNLPYVGHSQGTSQMFYAFSVDPWFNDKVSVFVALGPVTKLTNAPAPALRLGFAKYGLLQKAAWAYDIQHVGGDGTPDYNSRCVVDPEICVKLQALEDNTDPDADDVTRYAVASGHPGGASPARSPEHFAQMAIVDRFQVWAPNFSSLIHKQRETDLIPIGDISIDTYLFVGRNDTLADDEDARWIQSQMGDTCKDYIYNAGGHVSFIIGKDMSYWTKVLDIFHQYQPLNAPQADAFLQ